MAEHADTGSREQRETIARDAYLATTAAVTRTAGETSAELRERKPGSKGSAGFRYAEPGAGLRIACAVAVAAGRTVGDYIRYAREDGLNWQETGAALDLEALAAERGLSVAETALDYAAGKRTGPWNPGPPAFHWTCSACGETVSDRGPGHGHPEDDEPGHAEGCPRLAAAVAVFDQQWTQDA